MENENKDFRIKLLVCYSCPEGDCGLSQHTNGLIAWCEAGHVYELNEKDERYSPV